tara:strand:- start:691 stop:897 length:207 start_codon:yes stop_codon:yes gene_type:complete
MVEVKRVSPLSGQTNSMFLDISAEQIEEWNKPPSQRRYIQEIFPNLTQDEREFIMTGYTSADWKAMLV